MNQLNPERLRVAHLSRADCGGGAAGAVLRLHRELVKQGVESRLYVADKLTTEPTVTSMTAQLPLGKYASTLSRKLDLLPVRVCHPRSDTFWSPGWHGLKRVVENPDIRNSDVICLYWLPRGFLGIRQVSALLKMGKPVVWRLSDMWPFTGGCHYSGNCVGFQSECGRCPQLKSTIDNDLSKFLFRSKRRHWRHGALTVVSPSKWVAESARLSPIFADREIRIIPTGVDTDIYRPHDMAAARRSWNLPQDKKLVLFGADAALNDERKGSASVIGVVRKLAQETSYSPELVVFGASQPGGIPPDVRVHMAGMVTDESRLAELYSACDVFVAPSKQENLANTVLESMACGTPVIAFDTGGMPDAIADMECGILVKLGDDDALSAATNQVLTNDLLRARFSSAARSRVLMRFDQRLQAKRYIDLYRELISRATSGSANL